MLGPLLGLAKSIYYYLYVLYPCIPLHKWRLLLGLGIGDFGIIMCWGFFIFSHA